MRRRRSVSNRRAWDFGELSRAAALAAAVLVAGSARGSEITSTWSGNSGDWTDPTQWSTNPNYPNNDTPSGTTYDAVINAPGAGPYTVTLASSVNTDSVTLDSANATLSQTGGTLATTSLNVSAGTYLISGGSDQVQNLVNSGTVRATNGGTLSFSGSIDPLAANGGSFGGRIDNTGGTTVVDPGSEVVIGPSRLTTSQLGNLVNNGGTILLEGLFDNTGNTFTFGGSGTWILGSPTQPDVISGGLVTILPGTVINHGLGLNNLTLGGDLALPAGESISVSEFDGGGHNVSISGSDTAFAVVPGNSGGAATLSNVIVNLGGDATNASGSYLYSSEGNPHADGDLVLDDMTTVQGWGTIGADSDGNQDEYITNEGVISAGVSGKSLVIFPLDSVGQTTFINTGTLQAINGGILNISEADWTNLGTIQALNGGIVTIAGQPGFEISGTGHNGTFAVDSNGQSSISYTGILVPSAFDATLGSNGACGILNITGSLSLGPLASLNLSMAPGAIFTTPYEIISYTGTLGGTFGQVTPGYVVDYSQPGEILVTAVPEPTGCGLLVAGAFAAMAPQPRQFRRR